ncbi:MAG: T9SS type A sorting domain-containing protein, partial [Bacteroidales bacterium]|nr:T9SS type A sorting domain-containing protein [Bacteroidales bacterium]
YNINAQSAGTKQTTAGTHFNFEGGNAADPVYTLYIKPGEGLETGDEIAAYAGGKMVGATTITSTGFTANDMAIFSTLHAGRGYEAGEAIELVMWDQSAGIEKGLSFTPEASYGDAYTGHTYPEGDGRYSIAKATAMQAGLDSGEGMSFKVYPNPADDHIKVESNQPAMLTITGTNGQTIMKKQVSIEKQNIDISELPAGIYTIRMITENQTENHKLIVR